MLSSVFKNRSHQVQDSLCTACKKLNLPSLFIGPRIDNEYDPLKLESQLRKFAKRRVGAVSTLCTNNTCRLCKTLEAIHAQQHPTCDGQVEECYFLPVRADHTLRQSEADHGVSSYQFLDSTDEDVLATDVYLLFLSNNLHWRLFKLPTELPHRFKLDVSSGVPGRNYLNHAGFTENKVNWGSLTSYLRMCEETHALCWEESRCSISPIEQNTDLSSPLDRTQSLSDPRVQNAYPIKCIDVQTMELSTLSLERRYVTLSYTWGRSIDPVRDWPRFFEDNDGRVRKAALPKTIKDAVTAVEKLGERFLWVDLICINQTDKADLERQLPQMDVVYNCSIFTIVALHGTSMDNGLPGVSDVPRSRAEYTICLNGRTLICGPHIDFLTTIKTSRWRERAWTFQEEEQSKRLVFFGDHEVLMRCSCIGRETLEWQTHEVYGSLLTDRDVFAEMNEKRAQNEWSLRGYQGLVHEYSARKLTFGTDILNAFLGMLNDIDARCGMKFIHALPKDDLISALWWCPVPGATQLHRRRMFPSWSWLEWGGSAVYYPFEVTSWVQSSRDSFFTAPEGRVFHKELVYIGELFEVPKAAQVTLVENSENALRITSETRMFNIEQQKSGTHSENNGAKSDCFLFDRNHERLSNSKDVDIRSRMDVLFPFIVGAAIESLGQCCEFVFLARFQGLPVRPGPSLPPLVVCRVFAILIRRLKDGTAERVAIVDMPAHVWDEGTLKQSKTNIILV